MREYEIRILRADKATDVIMRMVHLTDHAAIRAAKKLAEARPFEVWRGMDCIYGGHSAEPPLRWPPTRPAA